MFKVKENVASTGVALFFTIWLQVTLYVAVAIPAALLATVIGQSLLVPSAMVRPALVAASPNVQDVTSMQPQLVNRSLAADTVLLLLSLIGMVAGS